MAKWMKLSIAEVLEGKIYCNKFIYLKPSINEVILNKITR